MMEAAVTEEAEMIMVSDGEQNVSQTSGINDAKIIKTGSLSLEVNDTDESIREVGQLISLHSGYISRSETSNYPDSRSAYITAKIPNQQFEAFVQKVSEVGTKVIQRSVNTRDVTDEFIDLEARINNQRELEKRFNSLLAKAKDVEEMLQVEREIARIRTDIERMEGRLNMLKSQVRYSTLDISLRQEIEVTPPEENKVKDAFLTGWKALLNVLLGLLYLWPFLLIILIVIFGVRFYRKKKQMN
jgi:hypothetical protein